MCFSAGASFGASAILTIVGIASLKKVKCSNQIMFAAIPIIFALQQFTEGFVWLGLTGSSGSHWKNIPIHIFVVSAQILWSIWMPLSILLIETNYRTKKLLKILFGIGLLVSTLLAFQVLFYPVTATAIPYHIHYEIDFPYHTYPITLTVFYFMATIIPPFISEGKRMISLGLLNLTSFVVTIIFFENYVISIWCFFAALVSWEVFLIMKDLNGKSQGLQTPDNKLDHKVWRSGITSI